MERLVHSNTEKFRNEIYYLYQLNSILSSLIEFSTSSTALAVNNPSILLNGIAGSGKTHFLCDLAKHRLLNDLPTLIFLGEEFNSKSPWDPIRKLLGIASLNQQFLKDLDQYAANKRTRLIIIIDAVNESQISGIHWEQFNRVNKYKNLGVIISIRSGFEQSEISPSILNRYVKVEHEGFATHEWEALTKFFS